MKPGTTSRSITQICLTFFHFHQLLLPTAKPTLHFLLAVPQRTKPYIPVFTLKPYLPFKLAIAPSLQRLKHSFLPPYFRKAASGERLFLLANTAQTGSAVLGRQGKVLPGWAEMNSVNVCADTGLPNPPRGVLTRAHNAFAHTRIKCKLRLIPGSSAPEPEAAKSITPAP